MSSEHELFTEALSFAEGSARRDYLDRACGTDQFKRQRLNELLKLHETVDSVLERRPHEMIDSLNDNKAKGTRESDDSGSDSSGSGDIDSSERPQQSPEFVLETLRPFLEAPSQIDRGKPTESGWHTESIGRLAHYELLEILGQGGYGIVFKAFDTKLSRLVAVKILAPHLAMTSPPRRRFLREARAAAAVRNQHVVQIYAVEESPIPYLVMEFVSGETLQQRSDRMGPFETHEVIRLGQQIARGLAAAHDQGLIHRDIKPCNILITDEIDPVAKLSDFGLARTVDDASRSQSGIVIGTPMYMSPEQVAGAEVDQRTDLFSFGSVLYLMVTGRPPFRATGTLAVLKRVAEDKPRSIRDVIADAPPGLCAVISRLHSKSCNERYATAKDVDAALAICLETPHVTWRQRAFQPLNTFFGRLTACLVTVLLVSILGVQLSHSLRQRPTSQADAESGASRTEVAAGDNSEAPNSITEEKAKEPVTLAVATVTQPLQSLEPPTETVSLSDWDKAVGSMSAEDQVTAVGAQLKRLNPELDLASFKTAISNGVVSTVWIVPAQNLTNLLPIRALRHLTELRIIGQNGTLTDLSPLKGLKLTHFEVIGQPVRDISPLKGMPIRTISLWKWDGTDLSPLRGMPLIHGNFGGGEKLQDLEPLRGMKLEMACFNLTRVADLSPLSGMPLTRLEFQNTEVTDLTPVTNMPLDFLGTEGSPIGDYSPLMGSKITELTLTYNSGRDKQVLESMPYLKLINGQPASEFLLKP